ncbi:MAG: hypothetical protein RL662_231 [Bacteroidota bacterium]|jgi:integrase
MRTTTYKAEIYLRKLSKSSNKAPIRLRITKDRRSMYRTLLHVEPKFWDEKNECIKKQHPNVLELNALMESKIAEIKKEISLLEITDNTTCISGIRSKLDNCTSYNLFEHGEKILEEFYKAGQYSSYKKYKSVIKKLREYVKHDRLPISSITTSFINGFDVYLRDTKKNNKNTITVNMKVIAKLVNDIYKDKELLQTKNPFNEYKRSKIEGKRTFLEIDEVKRIEKLRLRVKTRIYDAKDVFLFECFTGLRISDILSLKWKNYANNEITIYMRKTDKEITIPIGEKPKAIIEKRQRILENNGIEITPNKYIFNILLVDVDKVSPREALNAISSATAVINSYLKEIAKKAEITKNISTHIGRHTFATLLASNPNVSLFTLRELLGHSDIRITQEYVKVANTDKIKAINILNSL